MMDKISYFINIKLRNKKFRAVFIFIVFLIFSLLLFFHLKVAVGQTFFPKLVGYRNVAFLDLWSIEHLFFGVFIGGLLLNAGSCKKKNFFNFMIFLFFLALIWESVELLLEINVFQRLVIDWRGDHEHWTNRFISDPALLLAGGALACKYKILWKIILFFTLFFGLILIFW